MLAGSSIATPQHTSSLPRRCNTHDLPARCRRQHSAIGSKHWSKYMLWKSSIEERTECSSGRARAMVSGAKTVTRLMLVAVVAWHATARADDIMDRRINFHIAASPLPSALIEFSSQSGVQVAAADAAVSNLKSNGVNGTYSGRAAMAMLLQGTGLAYSQAALARLRLPRPGRRSGPWREWARRTARADHRSTHLLKQ